MASHRKLRSGNEWRNPFRQPKVVREQLEEEQRREARERGVYHTPNRRLLTGCILFALAQPPYQEKPRYA